MYHCIILLIHLPKCFPLARVKVMFFIRISFLDIFMIYLPHIVSILVYKSWLVEWVKNAVINYLTESDFRVKIKGVQGKFTIYTLPWHKIFLFFLGHALVYNRTLANWWMKKKTLALLAPIIVYLDTWTHGFKIPCIHHYSPHLFTTHLREQIVRRNKATWWSRH